ncbi:MAG: hypothetical protein DCC57_16130, partial [Chloroflexi bacterium]
MNGDGNLDIVTDTEIHFNNGQGAFSSSVAFVKDPSNVDDIAVGDMNGDGALDIVVARMAFDSYILSTIYFNDGTGNFPTSSPFSPGPDWMREVAVGDMNGDGSLDIVAQVADENLIYYNDGRGNFSEGETIQLLSNWANLEIGDLNGDDALDIAARNKDGQYQVL